MQDLKRAENFEKYLSPNIKGKVPVYLDPDLEGNTVRVNYDIDEKGLVTNIHIRCGLEAKPMDIVLHDRTARTMLRYSGFMEQMTQIKNSLQKQINNSLQKTIDFKEDFPEDLRFWEARREVELLEKIIKNRLDAKSELGLKDNDQITLDAEIQYLEEQLALHEKNLNE